jgi:hypothetical protein
MWAREPWVVCVEKHTRYFIFACARCYTRSKNSSRLRTRIERAAGEIFKKIRRRESLDCLLYLLIDKCALVLGSDKTDYNENVVAIKENGRRRHWNIFERGARWERERNSVCAAISRLPHLFYSPMMRAKGSFARPPGIARAFSSAAWMDGWVDEGEVCLTVAWVAYIPCENPHTLPRHFNSLPALSHSLALAARGTKRCCCCFLLASLSAQLFLRQNSLFHGNHWCAARLMHSVPRTLPLHHETRNAFMCAPQIILYCGASILGRIIAHRILLCALQGRVTWSARFGFAHRAAF